MVRFSAVAPAGGSQRERVEVTERRQRRPIARITVVLTTIALIAGCSSTPATSTGPTAAVTPAPAATTAAATASAAVTPASSSAPAVSSGGTPTIGNGKKQIGWAIGLHDLSVIAQMDQEMKAYASARGWEMLLDAGTSTNRIPTMTSAIQSWITQGVPAMCIAGDDPSAMAPLQTQALAKGLIWTVYGTNDMPTNPHAFVGFPATEAGAKGADVVVKYIKESAPNAEVLILTQIANPGGKPREDLPKAAIESQTDATVVAEQDGSDQVTGLQSTQAALTAHPSMRVVVSRTDAGALGAAQAFKQKGIPASEVFILTYDGSLQSLQELKDENYIKVVIALDLKLLADTVVQTNIDLALSGPPATELQKIVPTDIVDRDSPKLDELIQFYQAAG